MADPFAAELVTRFNHPFIGGEGERSFAASFAHRVQGIENRAGGLTCAVERR